MLQSLRQHTQNSARPLYQQIGWIFFSWLLEKTYLYIPGNEITNIRTRGKVKLLHFSSKLYPTFKIQILLVNTFKILLSIRHYWSNQFKLMLPLSWLNSLMIKMILLQGGLHR